MNIIIKGTNLELHNDLKDYVNKKIGGLKKFVKIKDDSKSRDSIVARVELARTTRHHNQGDIYKAEVNLQLPRKMIRCVVEGDDIYKVIDSVKDDLKLRINDYKNERKSRIRKGMRIISKLRKISPLAWAKNELRKFKDKIRK